MDEQTFGDKLASGKWMRSAGTIAIALLAILLVVLTLYVLKSYQYIGSGVSASNTISVSGHGEVSAVADIASFSVTVRERATTVVPAQDTASDKSNAIIAYLKKEGVEAKDIKTSDYNISPRYEYASTVCREGYCPPGEQQLVGYEVSMTVTVKVRDTTKAGALLSGVGSLGASEVSGLSFTIDDEEALQYEARGEAITEAREKAAELSGQLGVRLVRVVGFSESGNYPTPYAFGRASIAEDSVALKATPEIPTGENKIVSDVTITYEVR
ncbi:MAG TPA: SIMPL domain-containing protein [Candidatus Paceibacterota bacterium]